MTVSPGLRWDYFNASIPAQAAPAGRFVPERSFAAVENIPNWHTVVPRIGASYDVTGRGRTAVKGNFGLYVESAGTALPIFFESISTANGKSRARKVSQAFLTAAPFKSVPQEAAVAEVFGTLSVRVAMTRMRSVVRPSSRAAISAMLV